MEVVRVSIKFPLLLVCYLDRGKTNMYQIFFTAMTRPVWFTYVPLTDCIWKQRKF